MTIVQVLRSIGGTTLLICYCVAVPVISAGQSTRAQDPFRSGVAILELTASVLDSDGAPVQDLRESDFEVRVGGGERKVVVARFRETATESPVVSGAVAAQPSFSSNVSGRPGQVIVLAIDAESLKSGYERVMLTTAGRLLQSLSPNDAVGFWRYPANRSI
jgi:hypothetical protein